MNNKIARLTTGAAEITTVAAGGSCVSLQLLTDLESPIVKDWAKSAREIWHHATNRYAREAELQEALAAAVSLLAKRNFRALVASLDSAIEPASITDIKREVALLLAAYPSKDDLAPFAQLLVAEIASDPPSRLILAAACRKLRRTSKFRPSIAEVLELLKEERSRELRRIDDAIGSVPMRRSGTKRNSMLLAAQELRFRLGAGEYVEAGKGSKKLGR
jgi:hypothetical protein